MPNTVFVFQTNLSELNTFDSLELNESGQVQSPLEKRSAEAIASLSKGKNLHWVLPSTVVKPQVIHLPTLKQSDQTIPFLLEESLLDDIENICFTLDKKPVSPEHYLVYIANKAQLTELTDNLATRDLVPNTITGDYSREEQTSLLLTPHYALLSDNKTPATLNYSLLPEVSNQLPSTIELVTFTDSLPINLDLPNVSKRAMDEPHAEFVAKRFFNNPPANIASTFLAGKKQAGKRLPIAAYTSMALACLFFLFNNGIQYVKANSELQSLTEKTTAIYQLFFPNATAVISPRFRIEQRLKDQGSSANEQSFFRLIQAVHQTFKAHTDSHIDELQFQEDTLDIALSTKSFETLDNLRASLEKINVTVNQVSAVKKKSFVNARWRVK